MLLFAGLRTLLLHHCVEEVQFLCDLFPVLRLQSFVFRHYNSFVVSFFLIFQRGSPGGDLSRAVATLINSLLSLLLLRGALSLTGVGMALKEGNLVVEVEPRGVLHVRF